MNNAALGPGTRFVKSEWYSVFQGNRKFDLFAERDEQLHGFQRRLVSNTYAMESLKTLEPGVKDSVSHFLAKMKQLQGQAIDMGVWLQLFAFGWSQLIPPEFIVWLSNPDVVGQVTFSRPFGFMDAHQDDGIFAEIKSVLVSASWLGQMPWIYRAHQFLLPVFGNHVAVNARHSKLRDYVMRATEHRKDEKEQRPDIFGMLFATQKEKPSELSTTDVISMASDNVAAGSDTTAISLRAIIYFLLKHPRCKDKLVEEIRSFRTAPELPEVVPFEDAKKLQYLQAVFYESMRLHSAVGLGLPRITPPGGIEINKHYIPEGARYTYCSSR